MGPGEYLLGLALAALALGPVAVAAPAVRGRLLPGWSGAPARLAEAVVFLAIVWAVAQLLGVVGLLERVPLVLGLALAGVGAVWAARRGAASEPGDPPPAPVPGRLAVVAAAVGAALVLAQWGVQVVEVLGHGMTSSDTLSYHGPVAARFFQDGSITSLEFVYSDPIIPFLPFNSELLHAVGMLLIGSDVASPLINMGWLGLALLAAWCVGRPYGLGPASLAATCPFLASPALVTSQAGSAGNDIVAGALMLAAAALLLNGRWRPRRWASPAWRRDWRSRRRSRRSPLWRCSPWALCSRRRGRSGAGSGCCGPARCWWRGASGTCATWCGWATRSRPWGSTSARSRCPRRRCRRRSR